MFSLKGKRAFITGSAAGIGLAVAKDFIKAGATVIISDLSSGETVAEEIGASFIQLDVTDESKMQQAFEQIENEHGKLDIIVNNAGIALDVESIETAPPNALQKTVSVNLFGVYHGLKHGPKHMNDGGAIINLGSSAGSRMTTAGHGEYSASKAGVAYLTRTAAIELGLRGIRVNAVCPGGIAGTGMTTPDDDSPTANFYRTITALGRMGTPDELLGLFNYLASDASAYLTGQEICIDGGMSAGITLPTLDKIMGETG
jgi:NAD(P)-dependent dehydrogenase (short-subunit alcohol dehydrogenase family)